MPEIEHSKLCVGCLYEKDEYTIRSGGKPIWGLEGSEPHPCMVCKRHRANLDDRYEVRPGYVPSGNVTLSEESELDPIVASKEPSGELNSQPEVQAYEECKEAPEEGPFSEEETLEESDTEDLDEDPE